MGSTCPADIANDVSPSLPTAGPGDLTSPHQSPGNTIEPDLNITSAGGAGDSGLKTSRAAAEIDIIVNSVIPILNIPDVLPAFAAAFTLNARLAVITLRFDL